MQDLENKFTRVPLPVKVVDNAPSSLSRPPLFSQDDNVDHLRPKTAERSSDAAAGTLRSHQMSSQRVTSRDGGAAVLRETNMFERD